MRLTRMVMGMGESTSWPASNRVIREWFPASERGLVNGIFRAGAASGLPTMHLTMERLASGAGDQRFAWQRGGTLLGAVLDELRARGGGRTALFNVA
jgi:MFS family permease